MWHAGSFVAARRLLSGCGTWAPEYVGSVVAAGGLSCSVACGILVPRSGLEPAPPALAGGFLSTAPPRKPPRYFFCVTVSLLLGGSGNPDLLMLVYRSLRLSFFPFFLFLFFYFLFFFKMLIIDRLLSGNLFIYLFIYGCVGSSFLCEGFLYLWQAGATLHRGARASHYRGLSCCGAQAPDAQAQ